jgi:hypothetical protein
MVTLWCRRDGGGGRFGRHRRGLGQSRSRLTLLTRCNPSGDDAISPARSIICRSHQTQAMLWAQPTCMFVEEGHRSATGSPDGPHRSGQRRCKLDVRRLDSIGRGATCAQSKGSDGVMASVPARCGSRRESWPEMQSRRRLGG